MEEEQRKLIKDVFGSSSSESEDDPELQQIPSSYPSIIDEQLFSNSPIANPNWLPITGINGLWLCRDFLSADHQSLLLSLIEKEGWFTEASQNQAMRFGDLPSWAIDLSRCIHEAVCTSSLEYKIEDLGNNGSSECVMPSHLLWREPFFDQLICNVYQPGEGICAHVDLMRFEDGIAIASLESSCVMHFSRVGSVSSGNIIEAEHATTTNKVPVYLTPGSLVIMWGEARYNWRHEINRKAGFQIWEGQELDQKRRTSITLRKLCRTE
ncbi:hypothetical protein V2J09_002217 [Rumex salicifolius]